MPFAKYKTQYLSKYRTGLALLVLFMQLFFTFKGVTYWGMYYNPLFLFISFILLLALYFNTMLNPPIHKTNKKISKYAWLMGILSIVALFPSFRALFRQFPDPGQISDVLPQLQIMFQRFLRGQMPYQQIILPYSRPFPVYMPLHWFSLIIPYVLHCNIRWAGPILLLPTIALYTHVIFKHCNRSSLLVLISLLPACVLLTSIYWGQGDLALSLETVIAAYYLVLAVGLYSQNDYLTIFGIVLCLLSRYTLLFWLPLFTVLLFYQKGLTKTLQYCCVILAAIFLLYIIPFMSRDPAIFTKSLIYHNGAALWEWGGNPWSFKLGDYFGPWFRAVLHDSTQYNVNVVRGFQIFLMFLLFIAGLYIYNKVRSKISIYDFALGMLYLFIVSFYMFSPLTYRYYMLVPLSLSAVLCAKISSGPATIKMG
jgi:hypothetical protein